MEVEVYMGRRGEGKNMGRDNVEVGPVRQNELPGGGEGQGEGATLYPKIYNNFFL